MIKDIKEMIIEIFLSKNADKIGGDEKKAHFLFYSIFSLIMKKFPE